MGAPMKLSFTLGNKQNLAWAQEWVTERHYLKQPIDPRARPMVYLASLEEEIVGLVMVGIPHATRCRGWWGYPGLPTQWQVVDLCRIWVSPIVQKGGDLARPELVPGWTPPNETEFFPTVASWMIGQVKQRIQVDRVSLWPPVFPQEPYHIRLIISYHDPQYHRGTIYRATNALPMYTTDGTKDGLSIPGPSGKFGWCWKLKEPRWTWQDIEILQPRTMRMALT